jgi:hypothetical protein
MANTNRPMGFKPANIKDYHFNWYPVTAAQVLNAGDVVSLDSAGTVVINGSLPLGIAATNIIDPDTGLTKTTAKAGDVIGVWDDPYMEFIAQTTTYAVADPYTTRATGNCFDVGGATGVQYVDAGASSADTFKVCGLAWEENGKKSVVGAYAKIRVRFNLLKHVYGTI